jgi:mono/diheme cytochrome c family protein
LHGLLAEFDSPGALLTAAERVRDAGYTKWDTHSPFPVHGIDEAMGIRRTRLPWLVFVFGLLGCTTGLALQWWTNASDSHQFPFLPAHLQGYAFQIGGKPLFSLPANIPVIFELTVLLSALATVIGMLAMNNLPRHNAPLLAQERFKRVTTDRFYVCIAAADPRFDATRTHQLLSGLGGSAVESVATSAEPAHLPRSLIYAATIVICLLLLPPLFVAKARFTQSNEPRIQIIRDMGNQERYKTQQTHVLFADNRAMRPQVPGTVARGDLRDDAHYYEGKAGGDWATTYPPQLEITESFVRRGRQRFNIYCAACHGLGGAGDGIVSQRALARDTPGWTVPTSLVSQTVIERPLGHIFNTVTNGIRTMPPYGDQIPEQDRWAIIAYVRALERSQNAHLEDVPVELRPELR